jgi:hypothetical protein
MLVTQLETWCSLPVLQVTKIKKSADSYLYLQRFGTHNKKERIKEKKEKQLHCTAILRYTREVLMQLVWLVSVACSTLRHGA